jgi:hypothetical protein
MCHYFFSNSLFFPIWRRWKCPARLYEYCLGKTVTHNLFRLSALPRFLSNLYNGYNLCLFLIDFLLSGQLVSPRFIYSDGHPTVYVSRNMYILTIKANEVHYFSNLFLIKNLSLSKINLKNGSSRWLLL